MKLKYCKCGCGKRVSKPQNKYILGHNQKSTDKTDHRWKPGQSGNPSGCPTGSRRKNFVRCDKILEQSAPELVERLIQTALEGGNIQALRTCIERILPVKKSNTIKLEGFPEINDVKQASAATSYLLEAVLEGKISVQDSEIISRIISKKIQAIQVSEIEMELKELKSKLDV